MLKGATTDLAGLIGTRFRARHLNLFAKGIAKAQAIGLKASTFRGRGLEFEEVRHYQAGDELRAIDWRVTARTGVAHTKLFREERERPILLLVDLRANMGFGSVQRFKSVAAAELASLLSWAALQHGDRIGGFIFSQHGHQEIRPAHSASAVLRILQSLDAACNSVTNSVANVNNPLRRTQNSDRPATQASGASKDTNSKPCASLALMLAELRRVAKPGSGIFLLSDFNDFDENCARQLHLLRRHCDVNAIRIFDPLEQTLPAAGTLAFRSADARTEINTNSAELRAQFESARQRDESALASAFAKQRILLRRLSTADDVDSQLSLWFNPRASRPQH